ncbi:MAG: hypothetical protein ACRDJJ_02715 [Actinomycetota bacterium]
MKAYVLVQTDTTNGAIAPELMTVHGVLCAEELRGPYDAIALARSDPSGHPVERVLADIRKLPGVIRALAAPLVRSRAEDAEAA